MVLTKTDICNFGWKAPPFTLDEPQAGQSANTHHAVSLESVRGERATLIMFICNHCPYVVAIAKELSQCCSRLQKQGVGIVAINANDWQNYPDDAPERMPAFAKHYGFSFPYLIDRDQSVAKAYDAVCTPDFFGFNADLSLQYRGRFSDLRPGMAASSSAQADLEQAMSQIVETGEGPQSQIPSMGCSIKWRR